jgi:hypothetical protein
VARRHHFIFEHNSCVESRVASLSQIACRKHYHPRDVLGPAIAIVSRRLGGLVDHLQLPSQSVSSNADYL